MIRSLFILVFVILLSACGEDVSPLEDRYAFVKPGNFPDAIYTFQNNPITKEGIELGRALFYDPVLSSDSTIACANCHQQARSFSDPVHRFSKGVNDVSGFRNAPAIQNMAFQDHFFWDGGVNHLDFVPINAITSEVEMDEKISHVVDKIQRSKVYTMKFKSAFGSTEVTSQRMFFALSQFMNLMISANSRYDKYVRNEGVILTGDELAGLALFRTKCGGCHAADLFTDGTFRNNGLNVTFELDSGRQRITEFSGDRGKFKVPSLRNAELTAPYMHDGSLRTLQDVLDHYTNSIKISSTLDPMLNQNGSVGIPMSADEKSKIIVFIKTLTDREFITDKRFSNPYITN